MQSRIRNRSFQLVILSVLLLLRYSFSWSIPILILAIATLDSSAQTTGLDCKLAHLNDEWNVEFLYSVSKEEIYGVDDNVLQTLYAWEIGRFGTIGVYQTSSSRKTFSYQIFNITPRKESPITSKVVVEIQYTSFQGNPGNLRLKELPLALGSARVQSGSQGQGISSTINLIEKSDNNDEVTFLSIDNNIESYCPLGFTTIRFEITDLLPEGKATETVWAIGPAESTGSADTTSFDPFTIKIYECEGDGCIKPKVRDLPPPATLDNCVAYDTGQLRRNEPVPLGVNLHFVAVPQQFTTKELYFRDFLTRTRPSGFSISRSTVTTAQMEFSNGTIVSLGQTTSLCKQVAPQNTLGSMSALLRLIGTYVRVDALGRTVETKPFNTIEKTWEWVVEEVPPGPSLAKRADINPVNPLDPRVYYLDTTGAVQELAWFGDTNTWQVRAVLQEARGAQGNPAPMAAPDTALSGFGVGVTLDPRVYYLDTTGAVQELAWFGDTNTWQVRAVLQEARDAQGNPAPMAAPDTALTGFGVGGEQ